MDWKRLLNPARYGDTVDSTPSTGRPRTPYDRDSDRVIFSGAFRRLSRKTQVHPLAANDHVHTRLTHSLETSRVGWTLGKSVYPIISPDLPKADNIGEADIAAIVQAACLAHDIGNPPFGHGGEDAMMDWFARGDGDSFFANLSEDEARDLALFDGNAQGFRVLTQLENHIFDGGLRLTYATLATFLKYPSIAERRGTKFSAFLSEKRILDEVAEAVGLDRREDGFTRHPLAFLMEAADDICYSVLDLEDAVELMIVPYEEVRDLLLEALGEEERKRIKQQEHAAMFRVNLTRMRGPVFEALIAAALEAFQQHYDEIMEGGFTTDLFESLGKDERAAALAKAKDLRCKKVDTDRKKIELELGAYTTLNALLTEFCKASGATARQLSRPPTMDAVPSERLDRKSALVMQILGDHAPGHKSTPEDGWTDYQCYRRAIDFVSGMTDNYATYLAKQMMGMGFTGIQRP